MLKLTVDWFTYNLLGLDPAKKISEVLNFFLYDSIKIILLLFVMISVVGFLRSFISPDKTRRWLHKKRFFAYLLASLLGAITPFCSCSSIPLFIGFLDAGIPLGVTFSFLVTSPLINEYLVVIMLGFFGWKITSAYVVSGLLIGLISGMILGRMNLNKHLVKDFIPASGKQEHKEYKGIAIRIRFGLNEAKTIVSKIWLWVLVGVGVGAIIHNYVPQSAVHAIINRTGMFSVPIAVVLGVPMYGSCAAIVPIAVALFDKGFPLGTALAFMMAVSALSLPEAVLLRRAMKLQLIGIFFLITSLGIIFTGYLFNILQSFLM